MFNRDTRFSFPFVSTSYRGFPRTEVQCWLCNVYLENKEYWCKHTSNRPTYDASLDESISTLRPTTEGVEKKSDGPAP